MAERLLSRAEEKAIRKLVARTRTYDPRKEGSSGIIQFSGGSMRLTATLEDTDGILGGKPILVFSEGTEVQTQDEITATILGGGALVMLHGEGPARVAELAKVFISSACTNEETASRTRAAIEEIRKISGGRIRIALPKPPGQFITCMPLGAREPIPFLADA